MSFIRLAGKGIIKKYMIYWGVKTKRETYPRELHFRAKDAKNIVWRLNKEIYKREMFFVVRIICEWRGKHLDIYWHKTKRIKNAKPSK